MTTNELIAKYEAEANEARQNMRTGSFAESQQEAVRLATLLDVISDLKQLKE